MSTSKIYVIIFSIVSIALLSFSIWGNWADKTYEKTKEKSFTWFWLKIFNIKQTKENCITFIKLSSCIGVILIIVVLLAILLFSKD